MRIFSMEDVERELQQDIIFDKDDIYIEDYNDTFTKVKNIVINEKDGNWVEISLKDKKLKVTKDHPFIVEGKTVYTKDLKSGDYIEDSNGNKIEILAINNLIGEIEDSYDVETESHSFVFSGIHSHNCRTYVEGDNLVECSTLEEPKKYRFERAHRPPYEITAGRGNFNFITLNLPKFAIESVKNTPGAKMRKRNTPEVQQQMLSRFYRYILQYGLEAKDILQIKERIIGNKLGKNFQFVIGQNIIIGSDEIGENDKTAEIWKHFSKSIGYIGIYEAMLLLYNDDHVDMPAEGIEIVRFIRQLTDALSAGYYVLPTDKGLERENWWLDLYRFDMDNWDELYHTYNMATDERITLRQLKSGKTLTIGNWSCFATPAEGLCMSSRNADFKEYGKIKGITDKGYYSNSNHVWVGRDISIYDKAITEAPYHALANAGNIFYIETDGLVKDNPRAFHQILETLHDAECGYSAINHPVDTCSVCHYQGVIPEGESCPKCGAGEEYIERLRRITGYLVGSTKRWNMGKRLEEKDRVKHH